MAITSRILGELAAEMTPAVRAFIDTLLKRITALEARINEFQQGASRRHGHRKATEGTEFTERLTSHFLRVLCELCG